MTAPLLAPARLLAPTPAILISEIFGPTIQGEGALAGVPTVFVRTGGCDFRCSWCDTLYAVLPEFRSQWGPRSADEIFEKVQSLCGGQPLWVTLSGGNPALQPLEPLLQLGRAQGYRFALETQGSVVKPWFGLLSHLVLSPKPPSSGMEHEPEALAACIAAAGDSVEKSLKLVVFDEADFAFAREVAQQHPELPVYLQPGTDPTSSSPSDSGAVAAAGREADHLANRVEWLLSRVMGTGWTQVKILPQVHVLLWGSKRGV